MSQSQNPKSSNQGSAAKEQAAEQSNPKQDTPDRGYARQKAADGSSLAEQDDKVPHRKDAPQS